MQSGSLPDDAKMGLSTAASAIMSDFRSLTGKLPPAPMCPPPPPPGAPPPPPPAPGAPPAPCAPGRDRVRVRSSDWL